MVLKYSEHSPVTPSLEMQLVGLKDGANSRATISAISTLIQAEIDAGDVLPPGEFGKVMYFGTSWGASNNLVTDGSALTVGDLTLSTTRQLSIVNSTNKDTTIGADIKEASVVVKRMEYTKNGMLFVTDGTVPANINTLGNRTQYGLYSDKGIIAKTGILLDSETDVFVKYGTFHATTGAFTEKSKIGQNEDLFYLDSKGQIELRTSGAGLINHLTGNKSNGTDYTLVANAVVMLQDLVQGATKVCVGGQPLNAIPNQTDVQTNAMLRVVQVGANSGIVSVQTRTGTEILRIDADGKTFMNLATSLGGSPASGLLQLHVSSGNVKLG